MHCRQTEEEAGRIVAATIYLMSCHARTGCPRLACMVERHLRILGRHGGVNETVRDMAQKMSAAWNAILVHDEHVAAERHAAERRGAAPLH